MEKSPQDEVESLPIKVICRSPAVLEKGPVQAPTAPHDIFAKTCKMLEQMIESADAEDKMEARVLEALVECGETKELFNSCFKPKQPGSKYLQVLNEALKNALSYCHLYPDGVFQGACIEFFDDQGQRKQALSDTELDMVIDSQNEKAIERAFRSQTEQGYEIHSRHISNALKSNSADFLDFLLDTFTDRIQPSGSIVDVARSNKKILNKLKEIVVHSKFKNKKDIQRYTETLANGHCYELLDHFLEEHKSDNVQRIANKWMKANANEIMAGSLQNGTLSECKWLESNFIIDWDSDHFEAAFSSDEDDKLAWMITIVEVNKDLGMSEVKNLAKAVVHSKSVFKLQRFLEWELPSVVVSSFMLEDDHTPEFLDLLKKSSLVKWTPDIWVRNDVTLSILRHVTPWILSTSTVNALVSMACKNFRLDYFRYLLENVCPLPLDSGLWKLVAESGFVEFFTILREAKCPWDPMVACVVAHKESVDFFIEDEFFTLPASLLTTSPQCLRKLWERARADKSFDTVAKRIAWNL